MGEKQYGVEALATPDFGQLFRAIPGPLLVLAADDPQFTIVAVNDAALQAGNKAREDLMGQSVFAVFAEGSDEAHVATIKNMRASFQRVIATGQADEMPVQRFDLPRADGKGLEQRYWAPVNSPLLGPDGAVTHIIHRPVDVTEQTRTQNELQASEQRFRAFVTNSSDAIFRMSPDWSEMSQLHGGEFVRETETPGSTWLDRYIYREDRERVEAAIQEAIRKKAPVELEHRVIRLDGGVSWTLSRAVPLLNEQGTVVEWFGAARDVTLRKDADEALERLRTHSEQQRRLYDVVLSATPDLVYVFDLQHRFTYANRALLAMWGKTWDEAIGKNCLELGYEPWHAAMHDRELDQIIATRRPVRGEVPFNGTNGRRIYDYILVPVIGADGQVEAVAGTTRDVTDRIRAAAKLRESEKRFRLMADAIPQIVWVTDAQGRAEFFNRQWREYVGQESEGLHASEVAMHFVHPDDQKLTMDAFQKAQQTGSVFAVEHRIRSAAGSYRWFLVRAEPYRDSNHGEVIRWFGSSTDIEDRKQAEARQSFLLALSDALRPLQKPEEIQAAAARVLGKGLGVNRAFYAEVDGTDWVLGGGYAQGVAALPPGRYSAMTYSQRLMETYRAGKQVVFGDVRTDPEFEEREREAHLALDVVAALGVPLVKDGQLEAVLTVHSATAREWTADDIALVEETAERTWAAVERATAEEAFRLSEERLTLALEAGGAVGIFDWDVASDRVYCDPQFAQLFSVDPDLATGGVPISQFLASIDSEDRAGVVANIEDSYTTGEFAAEYRVVQPDKQARWVFAQGRCHRDDSGKPKRLLGVVVDITTQVTARKELERVNRDLEEFAYVASHDLQEPLRMVSIYSELLVRRFGAGDSNADEYAQYIRRSVKRMETLILDLLSYSRTVQREDVPTGTADLSKALKEAQLVLQNRIEENEAVICAETMPKVRGDTEQMAHVFQNLLSNALKYRKEEVAPEIYITAEQAGDEWKISVRDNGIGFEPQYADKIFGLFKRLHKDGYPGTGLGLAICQRIVERYGGRIWADGRLGDGATFSFALKSAE